MDTNALIERARSLEAGAELDAMFFETCWGWNTWKECGVWIDRCMVEHKGCPPVTSDANACEAWAMRWARENGVVSVEYEEFFPGAGVSCDLWTREFCFQDDGTDWKHALVRACIVAALTIQSRKETT